MKTKIPILTILMVLTSMLNAQIGLKWVNLVSYSDNFYIYEEGYDVAADTAGNVFVCGHVGKVQGSYFDNDAMIQRISPDGETLWVVQFGDDGFDENATYDIFYKIILDAEDSCIYAAGQINVPSSSQWFSPGIVKVDYDGNLIWEKVFDDVTGRIYDMILDGNSLYFCSDVGVIGKLNASTGQQIYRLNTDGSLFMTQDEQHNIYINVADGSGTLRLAKFDTLGNQLWTNTQYHVFNLLYNDDKIYTFGDSIIVCFDTDGNVLWNDTIPGYYNVEPFKGRKITVDKNGNYYFTLCREAPDPETYHSIILKYTPLGDTLWTKQFEGMIVQIATDNESNLYFTGTHYNNSSDTYRHDIMTEKLNGDTGEQIWRFIYDRDRSQDKAHALFVRNIDEVYVTGHSHSETIDGLDVVTLYYADTTSEPTFEKYFKNANISVYPNPFVSNLTFSFNQKEKFSQLQIIITDLQGRKIFEKDYSEFNASSLKINTSNWNEGIYFFKVFSNEKTLASGKLIKTTK